MTDLGGFVALTFKRGLDYINIPTTLLAMVDAAIGGKTGVDLSGLKNQIGIIQNPYRVVVDSRYLHTLDLSERRSGLAEVLKHGLIAGFPIWENLKQEKNLLYSENIFQIIRDSAKVKCDIVSQDIYENDLRKTLNFGHTLGHAIETYFLNHKDCKSLLHGEAIAIGMVLAAYLSYLMEGLDKRHLEDISQVIGRYFNFVYFTENDILAILELLKHDKKNAYGKVYFVLLRDIGQVVIDRELSHTDILKAFEYYNTLSQG